MAKQDGASDHNQLIPLAEASKLYGFNHAYLATLARKGRLRARKLGNIWVTTESDVDAYILSRKKVGAFREDIKMDD